MLRLPTGVGDIKFLSKEIRIERQVQRANAGAVEIRSPKYESVRTVYVPDEMLDVLVEHIRLHLPDKNPDQWMFPGEGEHPSIRTQSVTRGVMPATQRELITCCIS